MLCENWSKGHVRSLRYLVKKYMVVDTGRAREKKKRCHC
jgi:hypothetical protein